MSLISLGKLQQVIPEFVDSRLMPSAPSFVKWTLGGATFIVLQRMDVLLSKYTPMLKTMGIITEDNKIDSELLAGFINSAFTKSGKVEVLGFNFDKLDGEALITILEKYKDE